MWISKKKYNELVAQKDDFERIASNAVVQNGRLLDKWRETTEEMKDIQELNYHLQRRNEELFAHCEDLEQECQRIAKNRDMWSEEFEELDIAYGELEAKLELAIEQRDHYHNLLESTRAAIEEGKAISREGE